MHTDLGSGIYGLIPCVSFKIRNTTGSTNLHACMMSTLTLHAIFWQQRFLMALWAWFFPRVPNLVKPLKVEATWTDLTPGYYVVVDDGMWKRKVDQAPLNQRAWVFQGRFLTGRNLSFGMNRLFWECEELRACETFTEGSPTSIKTEFKVSNPNALAQYYQTDPTHHK